MSAMLRHLASGTLALRRLVNEGVGVVMISGEEVSVVVVVVLVLLVVVVLVVEMVLEAGLVVLVVFLLAVLILVLLVALLVLEMEGPEILVPLLLSKRTTRSLWDC